VSKVARSIFITGTDTGAGKTWVTKHWLEQLISRGVHAQALKPIASGTLDSGLNEDVEALLHVQSHFQACDINFHTFPQPLAPALAAQYEGYALSSEDFLAWQKMQIAKADMTLVEGVGGLMVPLISHDSQTWLVSDWMQAIPNIEVLLVAPLRLGCMNHILLSCALLKSMKQMPKWIVLNDMDKNQTGEETKRILTPHLRQLFGCVPDVFCVEEPSDLSTLF